MKNYVIGFSVTLTTARVIQADSEEEALSIAGELQDNYEYYDTNLIPSYIESNSGWGFPNAPESLGEINELPEMDPEDYEEIYGINPWKKED